MSVNIPYKTQDLKVSVTLVLPYTRSLGGSLYKVTQIRIECFIFVKLFTCMIRCTNSIYMKINILQVQTTCKQ